MGDTNGLSTLSAGTLLIIGIVSLVLIIFGFWINWRLVSKTGFSGALSLLFLIPGAGIILILVFAFAEWPIQKEVDALRQQLAMRSSPQFPPQQIPQQYPPQGPQYPRY